MVRKEPVFEEAAAIRHIGFERHPRFILITADGQTQYTLAQELGVDWSEVQAAMQAVHDEALQQAVEEGLITQKQADLMGDRLQMGTGGHFGGGMRGGQFEGSRQGCLRTGRSGNSQFGGYGWRALPESQSPIHLPSLVRRALATNQRSSFMIESLVPRAELSACTSGAKSCRISFVSVEVPNLQTLKFDFGAPVGVP